VKLLRRKFLRLAAGAAALPVLSRVAKAQAYPTRPVRIVVPYAAGGGTDITARLLAQWLSERLGQTFVIENRPGAATNIATEAVVNAPPDGYTLLLFDTSSATNATLYEKLNFNFIRDIAPIGAVTRFPLVMDVNPAFPAKSVPEFIAYAKANPNKINMASPGTGGLNHVTGELFKTMTGIQMLHVPYRGAAPALADLIGGQVQVSFDSTAASLEFIRTGKLRALAVTTARRLEALPDVPTVGDSVAGFEASGWYGLAAPKKTAPDIVDKLNRELNAALADSKMKTRLAELGGMVFPGSPDDLARHITAETEKWGKVIRAANIKAE